MATASILEKTGSVSDIEETHYRHLPDIFNHTNTPIEPFIHFYPALNLTTFSRAFKMLRLCRKKVSKVAE